MAAFDGKRTFRVVTTTAAVSRERLVRDGMKKTRIAVIGLRNRLRGKKP
jgi:hypothetical protein